MGEHKHPAHSRFELTEVVGQVGRGAGFGLLIGIFCLAVGLVRAALFILGGGSLAAVSAEDMRSAGYYIGGFGLAGGVVGGTLPRLRGRLGTYGVFACAGMIVMLAIMASEKGGLATNGRVDWIALMSLGAFLGLAFAYGWNRRR